MANRVTVPSKLLLKSLRLYSTVHLTHSPPQPNLPRPLLISSLNLHDTQKLFSSLPTTHLLRASAYLHAASLEPFVDFGTWLLNSKLMDLYLLRAPIFAALRHTFYHHFCAGEDTVAAGHTVRSLHSAGLSAMLTYAVEYATDNESCDRNFDAFLHKVESAKSLPSSSVSSVVVKITAICPKKLLERVSDLLRWQHKDPSFNLPWKLDTLPIFSDSSPTYHTLKKPEPLTPEEEHDLQLGHQRLQKICQKCVEANIPLTVDAEHTLVQPAIDYFTYSSAILYNKDDNPIIYGTIQCYLKDAKERLLLASKAADKACVPMGFKLVRGAYMPSEIKTASSLGFESPIHNGIQETHACYNDCASIMLDKISNGPGALVLATHNVESGRLAVAKAHDLDMGKIHQKLQFAQLYGMADVLSFSLKNAGCHVSKYMPFGPVEMVIPYLLRRAEENRGILSASTLDRQLMRKELKRRLIAAVF
ncbi:proline dehydrogenase 1, mitochondrial-like [Juglans regia]|uniref:Proline dehydrogenase n=2 Tax=Juglans regia TaxID=51240 RepID=A0A6P9F2R9_JUGRE|nr:proline dehydrogenase 1, mitochondrial-like [Juglans regia]